ncbi:hypothetical protein CRYUN_Cryun04dG0152500 [Craigia yunnanensis]
MKLHCVPTKTAFTAINKNGFHSAQVSSTQGQDGRGSFSNISFLNNKQPYRGNKMFEDNQGLSFSIVRDDLLHPFISGNKARKLDGLLPLIEDDGVTDVILVVNILCWVLALLDGEYKLSWLHVVVVQAHMQQLFVAVSCAERGVKSHLLLYGEKPEILTGYNLISTIYGNVTYVPRSFYSRREKC